MTAEAWEVYDIFLMQLASAGHTLETDEIRMGLMYSSYTPATSTDITWDVIDTDELATTHGYTIEGLSIPCTIVTTAGVFTLDSTTNPEWTASGGDLSCRYAVIWNKATTTNNLIAFSLLDDTVADVEATDGNTLTVTHSSAGILTIEQT
jgi:hypothetical protein